MVPQTGPCRSPTGLRPPKRLKKGELRLRHCPGKMPRGTPLRAEVRGACPEGGPASQNRTLDADAGSRQGHGQRREDAADRELDAPAGPQAPPAPLALHPFRNGLLDAAGG